MYQYPRVLLGILLKLVKRARLTGEVQNFCNWLHTESERVSAREFAWLQATLTDAIKRALEDPPNQQIPVRGLNIRMVTDIAVAIRVLYRMPTNHHPRHQSVARQRSLLMRLAVAILTTLLTALPLYAANYIRNTSINDYVPTGHPITTFLPAQSESQIPSNALSSRYTLRPMLTCKERSFLI